MKKGLKLVIRYKLLHVVFWIIKAVSLYHELDQGRPGKVFYNWVDTLDVILFQVLSVYTCLYYLLPRFYKKEKYFRFGLAATLVIMTTALLDIVVHLLFLSVMKPGFHISYRHSLVTFLGNIVDGAIVTVGFIIIGLIQFYYEKEQNNKRLEKEKLEAELNYLKSQINPHFLFNALNSIYVLMKEDVRQAEETLLKFSSLFRYQLYDCSNDETTLGNEIGFIRNYIELEQIRSGENRVVDFIVPGKTGYYKIAPFMLIPFIENAFKHVSHFTTAPNRIFIEIKQDGNMLSLTVKNTFDNTLKNGNDTHKGIGLYNVKRRLELLYHNQYTLDIKNDEQGFSIQLNMQLTND